MSRRYSPEMHAYLRAFIPGHTASEIAAAVNREYGIEMSLAAVGSYCKNHGIKRGTPRGKRPGSPSKAFPAEVKDYILAHYSGTGHKDMADRLNRLFGTSYTPERIKSFYGNHKLNSGLSGRFEKGHIPANKGVKVPPNTKHPNSIATRFKPGHLPHNTKPVGELSMRSDGYLYRKTAENPDKWELEHIRVYREQNGPIPEGSKIIFLDGNRHNCKPDNLALVSAEENLELNRKRLRFESSEITTAGIMIARARVSIRHAIKRNGRRQGRHITTRKPVP